MPKKRLISLIVAMVLVCVLTTGIYAASQTVHISIGDGPVQSAAITATNGANFAGHNSPNSRSRLFIDLQTSTGSGWSNEVTVLMNVGQSVSGSSTLSGHRLWRVQLNPQHFSRDCIGWGRVSNR